MATVFVTGGSGFIGQRLVRRLVDEGNVVFALARSDRSGELLEELGALPMPGNLADVDSLAAAAKECELAFHAAAEVVEWGPRWRFEKTNVDGTARVIAACREAGVRRLVHVSTEAVLLAGEPLVNVDETAPLRPDSKAPYCSTKAKAEQLVRDANRDGLETVCVRPRLVWGAGDTTVLPGLVDTIEAGKFAWIGGGEHLTDTTHVDNVVEGLLLAARRGTPGSVYFVTDGEPMVFRDFVTRLVGTQGVMPPDRSVPVAPAMRGAAMGETLWRVLHLPGSPPLTRMAVWLSSLEATINIALARAELDYEPVRTLDEGLAELVGA
ncbi:MAG TPA: NAD-dependent epimerase/dehydratase family protein [Thermoleophilaceae bacterium]